MIVKTGDRINDTIVALATPRGRSGIAVIRVSGDKAFQIVRNIAPFLPDLPESHRVYFGTIKDNERLIDECLVLYFKPGRSFTHQEVLEIHCHGNPLIIDLIVEKLIELGARSADPGEFSYRAFMSGRIDLVQAESILNLIETDNARAQEQAIRHLKGGLSRRLESSEKGLTYCLAQIEASIDFSTENLEIISRSELNRRILGVKQDLEELVKSYRAGRKLVEGVEVALFGRPNVGKSSLFNAILGKDRSIVSEIAGTTRDLVDGEFVLKGINFRFVDTAGLHETQDTVEKIGVSRAKEAYSKASVKAFVFDLNLGVTQEDLEILKTIPAGELFLIGTKADLVNDIEGALARARSAIISGLQKEPNKIWQVIAASSLSLKGIEDIKTHLLKTVEFDIMGHDNFLLRARHFEHLSHGIRSLETVLEELNNGVGFEFISVGLKECLLRLQSVLGKRYEDQIVDQIFKEFCLGK